MAEKLTDTMVRRLAFPEGKRGRAHLVKDGEVRGLAVQLNASGARGFVFAYSINGRERRMAIGPFPSWSVAAARERAKELRRLVDIGQDPLGERQTERQAPTVDDLCDRFVADHLPKLRPNTQVDYEQLIRNYIRPKLGNRRVKDLSPADIQAFHTSSTDRSRYKANAAVRVLRRMLNQAITWKWITSNPVAGIDWNEEEKRERFLAQDELARLWSALDASENQQSADAVRLLLLTGARKGEVLGATADQFDLAAGVWTKPAATTKQKKLHRVPLSEGAVEVVRRRLGRVTGPCLFPGPSGRPQGDIHKFWEGLCRRAGIEGLRIHDLRHSYASFLVSQGLSLPTIGGLLGHTQAATTQRYAHLADDALREATGRVHDAISKATAGNVVPLEPRRRRKG